MHYHSSRYSGIRDFRRLFHTVVAGVALTAAWLGLSPVAKAAVLTPGRPIRLSGTHGKFDFIRVDSSRDRLLLGHEGNKSFDVFDLRSRQLIKVVPTGESQDAAVDVKRGNYYVSGNHPARTLIVSAKDLAITGAIPLPADTDLIGYDAGTGLIHESNDTAPEEWVIDPDRKAVVATIQFKGHGVEDLVFTPDDRRLFQAVKGSNSIAEIDPAARTVLHQWPLAPDKNPHGIALDAASGELMVACAGRLVLMDARTGTVLDRTTIAPGVDEIAYDSATHTAYCASRKGVISVVQLQERKLEGLGEINDQKTGSIAVDPATHIVWIAYGNSKGAWVQPFTPDHRR